MASSLEKLEEVKSVKVQWRSFELRPRETGPLPPDYKARIQAGRPRLLAAARSQYGLELDPGPWGIDSRPALIGAKYAESMDRGPAYHRQVMAAYWLHAQDISDLGVLAENAEAAGLPSMEFLRALSERRFADEVAQDIAQAQAYGLDAVPALVFANKYLISGAQPYDVLVQVVERVREAEEQGDNA